MAKRGRPPKNGEPAQESTLPPIAAKLRALRHAAGLTRAFDFVSTPGWIKIENGQRAPSEKLLEKLCDLLVSEKIIRAVQKKALHEELCTLKYSGHRSDFLRRLARKHLQGLTPVVIHEAAPSKSASRKLVFDE